MACLLRARVWRRWPAASQERRHLHQGAGEGVVRATPSYGVVAALIGAAAARVMGLVRDLKKRKKGYLERGCLSGQVVVFVIMGRQAGVEISHMVLGGCRVERGNGNVGGVCARVATLEDGPSPALGAWE